MPDGTVHWDDSIKATANDQDPAGGPTRSIQVTLDQTELAVCLHALSSITRTRATLEVRTSLDCWNHALKSALYN